MTIRKVEPQPSAPRPVAKPSTPVTPKPAQAHGDATQLNAKTGRTSSFEAFKPAPVALHRHDPEATSEGRGSGTNDDSVGRGTNDDSIGRGRGTNDDSIGRGRGTNDDSIGGGLSAGRGTSDAGVGSARKPTARGTALVHGREGLKPETTAKMDAILAGSDTDRAWQADSVFHSPQFQAMPADQREKIVTVLDVGGDHVARGMAEMFKQSGGAMLSAAGKGGVTVLDSLVRLSAAPDAKGVVGDVMYDLVNPGRIWQGRSPTCTVSTMQYELAHDEPAEYARLMAGLVCDGKATMRGGGELATDASWDQFASSAAQDRRSTSEAIFQTAAMEYANGKDTYLAYAQESVGANGQSYRGLHGDQISTMIGQLFGVKYDTKQIGTDAEANTELKGILAHERPNRPVLFDITIDGQQSNHSVSLDTVRDGRVFYRDPTSGERESMTVADFRHHLAAVHYAPPEGVSGFIGSVAGQLKNLFF